MGSSFYTYRVDFGESGFSEIQGLTFGVRAFRIQPPRYKNPIHPKNLNVHNPERLSGRYLYDKWFRFKLTLHLFWTQTHILCPSFDRVKAEKFFLLFNIWLNLCMISRSVTEWKYFQTNLVLFFYANKVHSIFDLDLLIHLDCLRILMCQPRWIERKQRGFWRLDQLFN